jgi:agmatine/peptidylarginine deiminase
MNSNTSKIQSILIALLFVLTVMMPFTQMGMADEKAGNSTVDITVSMYENEIHLSYQIGEYDIDYVDYGGTEYQRYQINGESNWKQQGFPDLPNIRRSIIIPDDRKMMIDVDNVDYLEYTNVDIIPSKGILPRTINPDDVDFKFDAFYETDSWFPESFVSLDEPYILRDFRSQIVQINPVQYNPALRMIRVIESIDVTVSEDGLAETNILDRPNDLVSINQEFDTVYSRHFINYEEVKSSEKYDTVSEHGNMLVITYDDFYDEMIPFVEWKNMKGIPTEMVNLSEIGTTALEIDGYIDDYYFDNGLTFVLLVGDIGQVPSMDTPLSSHVSDPSYAYIVNDDNYQDIFIGRFSAQTADQVTTMVERSIEYERDSQTGADWYHKGGGSGSGEGTGDDNEYDWEHMRNLRYLLEGFTYSTINEYYSGDHGENDDPGEPDTSVILSDLNEGRSIYNHVGHGAWDGIGWGAMPGWYVLQNDNIDDLTNDNKLPFVVLVACNSGEFESYDSCFSETWMRATNNGEPTGAIGCFASTQSQSWDPPMEAQDEIVDLLVNEIYNTMGGLCYSGTMSMMDEYGSGSYSETDTWTLIGDPSLQLRTDTPEDMIVDHDSSIMNGATEFEVSVNDVEGALCALSNNGNLLGYGYTDALGETVISLSDPIENMDEVTLVVTAFNKMTYITTIDVMPPLRNIAEFDPMQGVLINYGGEGTFGIPYDLIAEMSEDAIVYTIVSSSSQQSTVESLYASNGVNTANCEYLIAPSNSYWTRDYGPWFRYNSSINEIEIIDFIYNRPRPDDDDIPNQFAAAYGLTSVFMDIEHTGGNYMTDGMGISASTDLVLSENPSMTEEDVQNMFSEYLGIGNYILYPDPLGEYIEHIDCWGKFLSPDTIMIAEVSPSHSHYDDFEEAATYFSNQMSSYGTPYNVVRVYCDMEEPYINSLILNNKVFVPISGSEWDDEAIASYESAMPGYEVLGFTGSWLNTDALHCRTKGIPNMDMLHMSHDELINQMPNDAGFEVDADIIAYGNGNTVANPLIHWKNTSAGVWNAIPMLNDEDTFYAAIPNHPCGETISYYISAENSQSELFSLPYAGESDPFSFEITLVPDIWIEPESLSIVGNINELLTTELAIGNDDFAGENLDFTLSCSSQGDWLSVDGDYGSIIPGENMSITVQADTNGLDVGIYEGTITINSDDPDTPIINVPVTLETVYGNNVGAVSINYPVGAIPDGPHTVNATVQNFGSNDQYDVLVNCSIFEGGIDGTVLIEDFSTDPTDWTITNVEGTAWTWDSSDERMEHSYGFPNSGYLDSPVLDCSGKSGMSLSFWHYWKADYSSADYQDGYVRGSIDGGATWPYLIDEFHHNDPGEETAVKEYDISSWADNQANVMIRFDVSNYNDWYWRIDDFNVSAEITGDMIYSAETLVDIPAYQQQYVEFSPAWDAYMGVYGIQVTTHLAGDEFPGNDAVAEVVSVEGPGLGFDPSGVDFGTMGVNQTDSTTFDIWNDGVGLLSYSLSESESWLEVSPLSGDSSGEHDIITVDVDTTGLTPGLSYHGDISISSDGGSGVFSVDFYLVSDSTELLDVEQSLYDRGFPVRHAVDGDWAAAQNFTPSLGMITSVDLWLRVFGTPEFDLTVELREDDPQGTLLDAVVFTPGEVPTSWGWFHVDFVDAVVDPAKDYFIVIPPAPSGVTTSFGYEWGYALDDVYADGSFWFTRDGGGLWRDLPDSYEFAFQTYGLI